MSVVSYTHLRQNLAAVMDEVCDGCAPVIVTRQNACAVVMLSLEEFEGMQETLHLLSSPRNAERLLESIAQAEVGKLKKHHKLAVRFASTTRERSSINFTT